MKTLSRLFFLKYGTVVSAGVLLVGAYRLGYKAGVAEERSWNRSANGLRWKVDYRPVANVNSVWMKPITTTLPDRHD